MSRSRPASTVALLTLVVLTLVGCSDDGSTSPMPTQSSDSTATSTSPSPSTSATSSPSGTATPSGTTTPSGTASVPVGFSLDAVSSPTFPKLGGDLGAIGVVRVGRHTGYDRVVWQFAGTGRPTFRVHYVDQPTADGSGDAVAVPGDAFIELMITTVGVPKAIIPRPSNASGALVAGTVVAQARAVYGGFEGYGQSFVGVRDHQRPMRVTVLTNPTRLVLDISSG